MPLERTIFTVYMDDPTDPDRDVEEYRIEVRATDQLRGELEGKRIPGVGVKDAMHTVYLWSWAAMVRLGYWTGGFAEFQKRCITSEKADGEPAIPVDPTDQAASSGSA